MYVNFQWIFKMTFLQNFTRQPDMYENPDRDCLIVALDLISGLAEGVGTQVEPLVLRSNLMVTIAHCIRVSHT